MPSAPSTYRPSGDENNRIPSPGRRGSGPHGGSSSTLLIFSEALVEHGPWTKVTERLDGRAWVECCDSCGITRIRIHPTSLVVSQPACRLAPAGAERSTTP